MAGDDVPPPAEEPALPLADAAPVQIIPVNEDDLEDICEDAFGEYSALLNENDRSETRVVNQDDYLHVNGNNNSVDVEIKADDPTDIVCVRVNGNSNITRLSIKSPVKNLYVGINGNSNSVDVTIAEGIVVEYAYTYVDGAHSPVNINQLVPAPAGDPAVE